MVPVRYVVFSLVFVLSNIVLYLFYVGCVALFLLTMCIIHLCLFCGHLTLLCRRLSPFTVTVNCHFSYLREVADDGYVIVGVEIEITPRTHIVQVHRYATHLQGKEIEITTRNFKGNETYVTLYMFVVMTLCHLELTCFAIRCYRLTT